MSKNLCSSRRGFLRTCGAAGALGLSRAALGAGERKYKFIDIHTHLGTFYWGRELTAEGLIKLMDEHGIERAVVLPLVSPESSPYPQTTEAALAASKAHPDRLIAFCAVDPRVTTGNPSRFGHVEGPRGIKEIIKRYKELGARGFGEHKVGLPFDHPLMMGIYESCAELELPILFHLDDIRSFDTPGLRGWRTCSRSFPRCRSSGMRPVSGPRSRATRRTPISAAIRKCRRPWCPAGHSTA